MKIFLKLAAQLEEEDFLCHITHKTCDSILYDIRKAHKHDIDSTPDFSLAKKIAHEKTKPADVGIAVPAPADVVVDIKFFSGCQSGK